MKARLGCPNRDTEAREMKVDATTHNGEGLKNVRPRPSENNPKINCCLMQRILTPVSDIGQVVANQLRGARCPKYMADGRACRIESKHGIVILNLSARCRGPVVTLPVSRRLSPMSRVFDSFSLRFICAFFFLVFCTDQISLPPVTALSYIRTYSLLFYYYF